MRAALPCSAADSFPASEDLTARALAGAGLAALVALPLLLLASVILAAPLAVPPAIGVGYLATSRALAAKHCRRAALINTSVLSALIGWLLIYLALSGSATNAGLTAALMTPLFAAAPAFVRSYLRARAKRSNGVVARGREAILERIAWLSGVAPSEEVLILDVEGRVLGATAAACARFEMPRALSEQEVRTIVAADDVGPLLGAIRHCLACGGPIDVALSFNRDREGDLCSGGDACFPGRKGEVKLAATVSACGEGFVTMRVRADATPSLRQPRSMEAVRPTANRLTMNSTESIAPTCDIGDAAEFALRHALPKAEAMRIALASSVESDVIAACDRQIGRRIIQLLVECALHGSQADGSVDILARKVKGVVLLRAASRLRIQEFVHEEEPCSRLDVASLRALVEAARGTLVVDREEDDIILSVRLDVAAGQERDDAWGQNVLAA
jgi:hypothetical protein